MAEVNQTVQICAYVPAKLVRALDDIAERKGLRRARAIEQACDDYVKRETLFPCPGCNAIVAARMRFCHNCGRPLTEEDAAAMQCAVDRMKGGVNELE